MNAATAKNFALPAHSGRYGAAMGRHSFGPADPDDTSRWYCARIALDSGGYESGACVYWGARVGNVSLYYVTDGESFARYVEARTRADALAMVRGGDA
jgi:hypothetical protein